MPRFYVITGRRNSVVFDFQKVVQISMTADNTLYIFFKNRLFSLCPEDEQEKVTYESICAAWVEWERETRRAFYYKVATATTIATLFAISLKYLFFNTTNK